MALKPGAAAARSVVIHKSRTHFTRRDTGIDMLLAKGRLTRAQGEAGRTYGVLERTAQITGEAAIRSFLEETAAARGGNGGLSEIHGVEWIVECRLRLARAQAALQWHPELIAVLNLICGRGMHPREITQDQRETEQLETALRIGLDQLIIFFRDEARGDRDDSHAA